ncbi:MAG TPA: hypothetical protein GXZ66_02180 [Clostridiaceae bacterium]|jgi:hypothetical protein|nr:hypothetical protein [Clostridiaceae bacterium]
MSISPKDKETLRKLGWQYMEIALLPVHREKLELWKALNRCRMQRPMVSIDQVPWNEICDEELVCQVEDPFFMHIELELRRKIYMWKHFPVDMVLEPYITIPKIVGNTGYGLSEDSKIIALNEGTTAPSRKYNRVLKDYEDIEKIKDMEITQHKETCDYIYQQAKDIFGGIAPVMQGHGIQFHLGVWDFLTTYIGVEDAYYEIMDRPDFVHACLKRITEATIAGIKKANDLEVHNDIANTCHCSYVYTDELLPDFGAGKGPVSYNSWAFGMAQLFSTASPKVTEEFELPYISKMAEYFGMIYYGCCDRLDDRLDIVKKIPNVRKVSCSPWSDRKAFAEKIGDNLVMSFKPNPAYVAGGSFDEDIVRKDLRYTFDLAKANNVNLEIILKDISTVCFDPSRLARWAKIAMEVVQS